MRNYEGCLSGSARKPEMKRKKYNGTDSRFGRDMEGEKDMALNSVKILYKGGTAEIEVRIPLYRNLKPVESEEEAAAFIAEIKKKYWDARHNCQAFTIGMNHELTRCSDDGEPAQTAGGRCLTCF